MAVAKIYISGNFLVAEGFITREPYFKVPTGGVHHLRDGSDSFTFYGSGTYPQLNGQPQIVQLGIHPPISPTDLNPEVQNWFPFADIVDIDGLPYASANDFDQFLNDNLGIFNVNCNTPAPPSTGLPTKSGRVLNASFVGNPKKFTVVFATPFPIGADYSPVITPECSGNFSYVPNVEDITPSGFVINISVNNIPNLIAVHWVAILNGETT